MRLWASIDIRNKCSHKMVSRKNLPTRRSWGLFIRAVRKLALPMPEHSRVHGQAVLTPAPLFTPGHHQCSALLLIAQRKSEMINRE